IDSQWPYAFNRHSSIHCGSLFFSEIIRMIPSFRPRGTVSDSISVTNPYLYSRLASASIVSISVFSPLQSILLDLIQIKVDKIVRFNLKKMAAPLSFESQPESAQGPGYSSYL